MCMQTLSETTLFSTYDLRLFSQLNWDLGSPVRQSEVLHPDEAFTGNPPPFSMVLNCAVLQQQLQPIFGGTNETSDGTTVGTNGTESSSGGPLDTLLQNCADVAITQLASSAEIDDELYCTFLKNTVRFIDFMNIFHTHVSTSGRPCIRIL